MKLKSNALSKDFELAIAWLSEIFGEDNFILAGSTGLLLNGKLKRKPKDIDILTVKDWYGKHPGLYLKEGIYDSNSDKFYVAGILVKCFKVISPNGISIDIMYRKGVIESTVHVIRGLKIKVQNPNQAIDAKKAYLKLIIGNMGTVKFDKHAIKHSKDVKYIDSLIS